jgi:lysozyme
VWTSGIGHTAGVVPKGEITERQAAANLVADVLNVEKRLAVCAPVKMPPQVYDALVSFSFNVGTGAACRSTLVSFIKRQQWPQACDQLTRWVYVNGEINKGLENRRARERAYCLRGIQ